MFGSTKKKQEEAERLSDSFKEKISELHLLIQSGTLSPEELARTEAALRTLKAKMSDQLSSETERRERKGTNGTGAQTLGG